MPTCPACGTALPGEFPFCPFCTAPLSAVTAADPVRERKVVSVLFCDLVGSTATSERMDPEEVQGRMAVYFARTRERIEAYGGTVEKFIGDAVMAVFGAHVAHEDDAERAVRAAFTAAPSTPWCCPRWDAPPRPSATANSRGASPPTCLKRSRASNTR
jgi:hypothetical protein